MKMYSAEERAKLQQVIGANLKRLRQSKGWSLEQLAALLKMQIKSVWALEKGESEPRTLTLVKYAQLYGVSVEEILKGVMPND